MKTILVPIDFSEISKHVLAEAVRLACAMKATVHVQHVTPPQFVTESPMATSLSADYALRAKTDASRQLAKIEKQLSKHKLTVRVSSEIGFPSELILQRAEKLKADYIVLGSHGHGMFYDLIVGSTASRVLKRAQCSVLIVPEFFARPRKGAA